MFEFKVPATSANLGPGFDSIGLAINKFLTITATLSDHFEVVPLQDSLKSLPLDETNLVFQVAMQVAEAYDKLLPPLKVTMKSEIPLTHGLGSSASAVIAGIMLANHFLELDLSQHEMVYWGSVFEGHPDNVGPCVTGGLFIGFYRAGEVYYETFDLPNVAMIVSTPQYELSTKKARAVLPPEYGKQVAVEQNAICNVMIASLLKANYAQMGELMMADGFHEPYRQTLIPEFKQVKSVALQHGAYASIISGAGPSILTLCPLNQVETIVTALTQSVNCDHEQVTLYTLNTDV